MTDPIVQGIVDKLYGDREKPVLVDREEPVLVVLTRRNLLSLLSKLDRKAAGEETARQLCKMDDSHPNPELRQTHACVIVQAVEDDEYYVDRRPGPVHPNDEPSNAAETLAAMNSIQNEPDWEGMFTRYHATGAYENGARIEKCEREEGDATPIGVGGVVLGSVPHSTVINGRAIRYAYFVEWDDKPRKAVAVTDFKIKRAE